MKLTGCNYGEGVRGEGGRAPLPRRGHRCVGIRLATLIESRSQVTVRSGPAAWLLATRLLLDLKISLS